ncbi:hypothetical protein K504DRAFT_468485 [Pleomassaria siparia CBS 279.74]|uniref:Uncharacterized protein n=1 Tax=Pleomassaria siparia CBS 279.74 TaxID=1314801 RepID=A0A6G1K5R2_9PLEO|nr:hypothetical protein K504DRAFT_468485 [Pleomassaria siparia CBS 279.74]
MHLLVHISAFFLLTSLSLSLALAAHQLQPLDMNAINARQAAPTAFTTARSANTEFAPPQTVTPPDPSATGTQTTSHEANTEIVPATTTGTPPPVYSGSTRGANTQAIAPVTLSSALAVPTDVVKLDVIVVVGMVLGIAGMV